MPTGQKRIGIVAPASRIEPALADKVIALARAQYGDRVALHFHPHCFLSDGHFAGGDSARAQAFLDIANDAGFDALWVARGGYGSNRIAESVMAGLQAPAKEKLYIGYSDAGFLLAALYKAGCRHIAHGPMPADLLRDGGEVAVLRALAYMATRSANALEPGLLPETKYAAFNITVLSHLLGTALEPDLSDHVLMLEEVSEHMYRIDRALFHITGQPSIRRAAGLKLGRCSLIPPNDPEFGQDEENVMRHWCALSGISYLGRSDIGHDVENKIVPFGRA